MKYLRLFSVGVLAACAAVAQTGVATEWDVRTLVRALDTQEQHLRPLLDQIKPDTWISKGAPQTYLAQWKSTEAELRYLLQTSQALSQQPEKLPLALDTYFRMESLDAMLGSLVEGIRNYQSPQVAASVQAVVNETSGNRDKLRDYIRELAKQKDTEFQIADREAQRCRAALLRQPANHQGKSK